MKIDVYNHVMPKKVMQRISEVSNDREMVKRTSSIPTLWDIEARLRLIEKYDDLQQVISWGSPPIEACAGPEQSPELARMVNDELAEICQKHKDRFPGFIASLPMNNPDAAVTEMDRAINDLHAAAIQIYTNVNGLPLDDPRFFTVFEHALQRDITIFMHPARGAGFPDYLTEKKSRYELWCAFGWPYETTVAMSRMVFSGLFDKLPGLRIVTHHLGGMVPYFEGRISPTLDKLGSRTVGEVYEPIKRPPLEYFKEFFGDTALAGAFAATRCGYEFFGSKQVLFATDCPFSPEDGLWYIRETIRIIDALGLPPKELDDIYEKNARRILRL